MYAHLLVIIMLNSLVKSIVDLMQNLVSYKICLVIKKKSLHEIIDTTRINNIKLHISHNNY